MKLPLWIQAATITIDGAQTTFDKTAFGFATADHVTVNVATLDHEAFYHLYTDQLTLGPDVRDITDGAFQFIQNTKKQRVTLKMILRTFK